MTLSEVAQAADNMKAIGVGIVLLTGGEPFMHDKLPELVRIFKSRNMDVRLQTAGSKFATEEKLRACFDAGARDINVSVDSLDFRKSDYINAVPGSGKNAIETIETISRVFREDSSILSLGTVLSRFNYKEIPAIIEFATRIGWYVSLVPVHITTPSVPKGFRSYDQDFVFTESEHRRIDDCIDRVISMKGSGHLVFDSRRFLESSRRFLKGELPTWRKDGVCDSPNLYFAIRPNGEFTTCCDYTLENAPRVFDSDFVMNYKSRVIDNRKDVREIIKNCSGCHYGSYPEVTISVRDWGAFFERMWMVFKSGRGRLAKASVRRNFVEEIESIKARYPDVYPVDAWMDPETYSKISRWANADERKVLVSLDRKTRKIQGRIRNIGEDNVIGAEVASDQP